MKKAVTFMASYLPGLARDAAGLGGATLIAYGVWTIHPAAGMIVGGMLMLAGAALLSRGAE